MGARPRTPTAIPSDRRSDTDSVLVTVENQGPIARAGPDRSAFKRTIVTLDGSASSDPNGDPLRSEERHGFRPRDRGKSGPDRSRRSGSERIQANDRHVGWERVLGPQRRSPQIGGATRIPSS